MFLQKIKFFKSSFSRKQEHLNHLVLFVLLFVKIFEVLNLIEFFFQTEKLLKFALRFENFYLILHQIQLLLQ